MSLSTPPSTSTLLLVTLSIVLLLAAQMTLVDAASAPYNLGTSIRDITGPSAEVNFMGYAMLSQTGRGLHLRLRARTFIVEDTDTNSRTVYVNLDNCMCMQSMKETVIERLHDMGMKEYTRDNVIISSTHTHSGPGGFSWYNLYDITSLGFIEDNFEAIVNSIIEGIQLAEKSMRPGRLFINSGRLTDSNINRSPTAYLLNPKEEREKYAQDGDTEKTMTVLKFTGEHDEELGMLAWFSVHGTSMNNTNQYVSGDNKGAAAYMFEKYKSPDKLPGHSDFIAAFAQTNEGDVSPNTRGPSCPDGSKCDLLHSQCHHDVRECTAKGPGKDMFESTKIIATKQFKKALELYESAKVEVKGPVRYRHTHLDMTNVHVSKEYSGTGEDGKTCKGAVGYSMAAGTTDGPGSEFFKQNDTKSNPFWNFISSFIAKPTPEQVECQKPKPILIDVGLTKPSPWVPETLPIQLTMIGKELIICSVPGEFTTMSGRRLKRHVKETLIKYGKATNETHIVIAGLANAYAGYVATPDEYQQQRYEAASTLFGQYTLGAYVQEMDKLAQHMGKDEPSPPGPNPPNLSNHTWSFHPGVVWDRHPVDVPFGTVLTEPRDVYHAGDLVTVKFQGAHLNNDLQTGGSYMYVDRLVGDDWQTVLTDGDWDTKVRWDRHYIAQSIITIYWEIAEEMKSGTYRIRHKGVSKGLLGELTPYSGTSKMFKVVGE